MLSVNFRSVRGMLGFFSVLLAAAMVLFPILIGILNFRESWLNTARTWNRPSACRPISSANGLSSTRMPSARFHVSHP